MDNTSIDTDSEKIINTANKIKDANLSFKEAQSQVSSNSFSGLVAGPDLISKYLKEFGESMAETLIFSEKIIKGLEDYKPDPIPVNPIQDPPAGGNNPPGGNGPGQEQPGPGPGPGLQEPDEIVPDNPDPVKTEEQIRYEGHQNANLVDTSKLEDLKLSELDDVVGGLQALAEEKNQKLDEYAYDLENAAAIKKYLLESKHIPQEFKDLIKDADDQTVRALLEQILKGERPEIFSLNNVNLGIIYKYLLDVAQANGISVEELLSDPKHSKLLQETLGKFENVVELFKGLEDASAVEFQRKLLEMYDGNADSSKIDQESIRIVRSIVDFISGETEIYYEELLTDQNYAETLKKGVMDFAKSALFVSTASKYTDEGMRTTMSNLFNGKNLKAFGMDENKVNEFKKEIDSKAREANTTAKDLLTDSKYEEQAKEALQDSKAAKGVGSIFKEDKGSVSQKVANTIYNTDFTPEPPPVVPTEQAPAKS